MTHFSIRLVLPLSLLALAATARAQNAPAPVLRLYGAVNSNDTHVVDTNGVIVHTWRTAHPPGLGFDLDSDGTLLRTINLGGVGAIHGIGGTGGGLQRFAFDGTLLWDFRYNGPGFLAHHDVEPLPNGNVLLIAWEEKTLVETAAAGRDPSLVASSVFLPDHVIEVQPTGPTTGAIVWEWHVWDHLIQDFNASAANFGVVANHPELIDINYPAVVAPKGDFNHVNGIDYDPIHDWILLSAAEQNEIWIIDHSTTTAEAAGHTGGRWGKGGDLLYRWGNPEAYRAGPAAARILGYQHAPRFVPPGYPGEGNVTVFNNRFSPTASAVHEIVLPLDPAGNFVLAAGGSYGPAAPVWTYTDPGLASRIMSSAERLPNGNTLVCSAVQDWIFEVTLAGARVWEHRSGVGALFHAHHTQRTLWASDTTVPAVAGGRVDFNLLTGTTAASNTYLVLCSASGTQPGTPLLGVTLPLNTDPLFLLSLTYPNAAPVFAGTFGIMNSGGAAAASFTLPPAVAPSGYQMHFAYTLFDPARLALKSASNPVPVTAN